MVLSCRLCLAEYPQEKLENVFQCNVKHSNDSLVDVLFWVLSVEIDATDSFSKDICYECVQLVEYILQVKNTFQRNQSSLRKYLQDTNCNELDDDEIIFIDSNNKVCNNETKQSSSSSTASDSPSRHRYTSKNIYGSSSPRVRVSLSALETMYPTTLEIVPLENTQEFRTGYIRQKDGCYKKRKYRHFKLDDTILKDICRTLDGPNLPLKKDIGVATDLTSFDINDTYLCTCEKTLSCYLFSHKAVNTEMEDKPKSPPDVEAVPEKNDFTSTTLDSNKTRESSFSAVKEMTQPRKNAHVKTASIGTLTDKPKRNAKNIVTVDVKTLEHFGPTVVLRPLKDILKEENYKAYGQFRYVKRDRLSTWSEMDDLEYSSTESPIDHDEDQKKDIETTKKQRFLDYYKNFSSFAVRELIAGKKIREPNSDGSFFKVSNVCSVFVCDFCSKSFLSQASLDGHYRLGHKTVEEASADVDLPDSKLKLKRRCARKKVFQRKKSIENGLRKNSHILKSETGLSSNLVSEKSRTDINFQSSVPTKPVESVNGDKSNSDDNGLRGKVKCNNIVKESCKGGKINKQTFKVKAKRRRKRKIKTKQKVTVAKHKIQDMSSSSYVWERKGLGIYSAISYYKKYSSDEIGPLDLKDYSIQHKKDIILDQTIQKLTNRLDTHVRQ